MDRRSDPIAFLIKNYDLIELREAFPNPPLSLREHRVRPFLARMQDVLRGIDVKPAQLVYFRSWLEPAVTQYEALRAPLLELFEPPTP